MKLFDNIIVLEEKMINGNGMFNFEYDVRYNVIFYVYVQPYLDKL